MSFYIFSDSACIWMLIFIHIYTSACVCWMQKYGQSSISYFEANHLLNHYSPFIWQIWNPIYKEDFQSDIDATLHASSSDEQVFMASATCTWSMGAESRWNILLLHRASTKINFWTGSSLIFQTIPNDRISNTSSWNIRQMGISRRPFCQHKWVSILSKLTLQARFDGNSITKLKKAWRFSACQRC